MNMFDLLVRKDKIEEQLSVLYSDARGQSVEYVEKFIASAVVRLTARLERVNAQINAARLHASHIRSINAT